MVSVHVDIDNIWNYEREFGAPASGNYDVIYCQALPAMLELFAKFGVRATFFLCADELDRASCREFCTDAIRRGHEIANHTASHPTSLYRLSRTEKVREIADAGKKIEDTVGQQVVGFRAPGYYIDDDIVDILTGHGYLYDTSVLPSFMNLLMGTYISLKTGRSVDKAFGRKRYVFASRSIERVYSRAHPDRFLYELPITTLPLSRLPIHSTMLYLLGERYLPRVLSYLQRAHRPSVYVFHAIDTLESVADRILSENVPALRWPLERRMQTFERVLASCALHGFATGRELVQAECEREVPRSLVLRVPMKGAA